MENQELIYKEYYKEYIKSLKEGNNPPEFPVRMPDIVLTNPDEYTMFIYSVETYELDEYGWRNDNLSWYKMFLNRDEAQAEADKLNIELIDKDNIFEWMSEENDITLAKVFKTCCKLFGIQNTTITLDLLRNSYSEKMRELSREEKLKFLSDIGMYVAEIRTIGIRLN